jgi:hypothetical protein
MECRHSRPRPSQGYASSFHRLPSTEQSYALVDTSPNRYVKIGQVL